MEELINKVAQSGLISFDLEEYYPTGERVLLDIKPWLYEEIILREKDFRAYVKAHDWSQYENKFVAITCSTDAIVPTWGYMLISNQLTNYASIIHFGSLETLETVIFDGILSKIDLDVYQDKKIVIKGCSHLPVPIGAYVKITELLSPIAQSIMYGEPCSTVPIFKRKNTVSHSA